MKIVYTFIIASLFLLTLIACRRQQKALYSPEDLEGVWLRAASNKPIYDSMLLEFAVNSGGTIISSPITNTFAVGAKKWQQIQAERANKFTYKDLGSDGVYYDGTMEFKPIGGDGTGDKLILTPNVSGTLNGNSQTWTRQ